MNKPIKLTLVAIAIGCFGFGCAGAPAGEGAADGDAKLTRTVVHLNGSAPPDVVTSEITRAEQIAEIEARRTLQQKKMGSVIHDGVGTVQEGITQDSSCAGSDLWMFDATFNTSGNEICFTGAGTATLSSYVRFRGCGGACVYYWNAAVRSYWSGTQGGFFQSGEFYENFAANTRVNVAGGVAQNSTSVHLY